jgi:NAD(P)-dependent dehydrogenase (short-subunit alcohol dehydrogenase family)
MDADMTIELPKIADFFDLTGKPDLVTGGTGALGSVAAKALAGAGAHVPLAGGNKEKLNDLVDAINAAGGKACGIGSGQSGDQ